MIDNIEMSAASRTEINRKTSLRRLLYWQHLPLLIIVIFTLGLHFSFITRPTTVVGDESYYVGDAQSIINSSVDTIPEHPALGKLFIIAGIRIFGDNPVGWRFFSIMFGTIAIILFYFVCRKLNISNPATIFATFLFALDNMFFVHASLGWLDIYMLTFMLAGFLLYLHKAYTLMILAFALSTLCKLSGAMAIPAVCLHWLLTRRDKPAQMIVSVILSGFFFLLFTAIGEYLIQGIIIDPVQRITEILRLTAVHKFSSWFSAVRPWEWILPHKIFSYAGYSIQYLSFISWTIQIFIIPAVIYMAYKAILRSNAAIFGVTWFTFTYLTWIPLSLITDRITYDFYFLPTTGAICIGIGMALSDMIDRLKINTVRQGKITTGVKMAYCGIAFYLLLHLTIFIMANPALPDHLKQWLSPIIR